MNLQKIIEAYLKEKGFDGLYNHDDCGCCMSELFPCDELYSDCHAGFFQPVDPATGYDFYIGKKNCGLKQ